MKLLNRILAVGLLLGAGFLQADTADVVTALWSNPVGGSGIVLNQINGSFLDIRWGTSTGSGKSGLGFDGIAPPPQTLPALGNDFLLGTLRHYNRPISSGTAASSADLGVNVNLTISGSSILTGPFNFRFLVDETPNATPCTYPSTPGNPCADRIAFQNLLSSDTFNIGGTDYTIAITGFADVLGGAIVPNFISQENAENDAFLYAAITAAPIPEPASILSLGTVLLLVGSRLRRKKA